MLPGWKILGSPTTCGYQQQASLSNEIQDNLSILLGGADCIHRCHQTKMFLQLLMLLLSPLPLAYYWYCRRHHRSNAPREPPSPFKLPIIGNLHQVLGPLLHRSLRDMSQEHGPVMLLRFGSIPVVVVSSAETAEEVMKVNDITFASRPAVCAAKVILYNCTDVGFAPYGEQWKQAKKLCTVHLLNTKRVESYSAVRQEEVAAILEKIASWSASGLPVNLSNILNSFANEVVTRVSVGRKYRMLEVESQRNVFCEIVEEMSALLAAFDVGDWFPCLQWLSTATPLRAKMRRCFRRVDGILEQVIEEHLDRRRDGASNNRGGNSDFVDVLLSLREEQDAAAASLSRDSVKAIILDMLAGGTDTSYVVLEWAMAELLRNEEAMKKTQEEVREIAKGESFATEDVLNQMTYLEAVIKEVMRLHPPIPLLVPRESLGDAQLGGYYIPSKTRVLVNAWAIGRDPKYWDEPDEFRPERFLGSPLDYRGQDFRYIPFGAGRRICPGITFAVSTIKLTLANLLHRFDWKLPDAAHTKGLDMDEAPGITARKKNNLLLVAMPRSS